MASFCSWDLGFDFATAKGGSGNYSLLMGFQLNGSPNDPVTGGVTTGSTLLFNLFNLGPVGSFTYTFSDVTIRFSSVGKNTSPFTPAQEIGGAQVSAFGNTTTITVDPTKVVQVNNGSSAVLVPGTSLQVWNVFPPVMMSLTGDFQVTVSITIQRSDGVTKTFVHDPEMVVGSGTGTGGDDDELRGAERGNQPVIARIGA